MPTRMTVGAVPTTRLVVSALASSLIVAAMAAMLEARQDGVSLTITYPPADEYISGPVVLQARVSPFSAAVNHVSFFADGRLACSVDHRPFDCRWDAGPGVTAHEFRVQAVLANGRHLTRAVRTKPYQVDLDEDVDVICVTAVVTDDRGNFVPHLPREAFRVFEDDVPQKIDHFASGDIPLEMTAAIDQSGSMVDAVPQLKQSVKRFLSALRPQDKVSLLFFNDNIFTPIRASVDPAVRLKAVDRLAAWGGTSLYDTIVTAVDMLGREVGRRSLVVFSDGDDTASHISLETAEKRLKMSDATVYTIAEGQAMQLEKLRDILERFARTSGGLAFATGDMDRLSQAFDQILEDLSNQYLLTYTTPAPRDGKWHRIRVQIVRPGTYRVRAREGYLAKLPARKG